MKNDSFNTVNGPVLLEETGYILPHEHLVCFPLVLEPDSFGKIKDHFVPMYRKLVEQHCCNTIIELTPRLISDAFGTRFYPSGFRRNNITLYKEISRASGMNLVLCTGFYREHTRPAYFFEKSVQELADEMIRDITVDIDDSGVKANIIKIAVDTMDSAGDRKLLAAAAIAQKATGVSISTHTCGRDIRFGVLNFLEGAGVDPGRIYLGHADSNSDLAEALGLARRGCNLLLTIWGILDEASIGWHNGPLPRNLSAMIARALADDGRIGQVLVSVDYSATCIEGKLDDYTYGVQGRTSCYAFTFITPALRSVGFSHEQIDTIMMQNPRRMLAL